MLWGLMVTNADLMREIRALRADVAHLHTHAITTEETVTELDDTTEAILSAVDDLLNSADPAALVTALARIDELEAEKAALEASAADTAAEEAALQAQIDELNTDVRENAGRLADKTAQIRAVVPGTPAGPVDGGDVPVDPPVSDEE
jgi:chromosome segregation ATPase